MADAILPDTSSVATFGGEKANLQPVRRPDKEIDANDYNRLSASAAMASHTVWRAWARVTVSGGVATLADHDAVWGDTSGVAPVVVRSGAGRFTVTWDSSYDDLRTTPETHTTNLRACSVTAYRSAGSAIPGAYMSSAVVATVKTDDAAGSAVDPDEFTVFVR